MREFDELIADLRRDVGILCGFENGREPGSKGHEQTISFLVERMSLLGLKGNGLSGSFKLPYSYGGRDFVNILGRLDGRDVSLPPVCLAAHFDTFGPYPGADDNAAAVACLLLCVDIIREYNPCRSCLITFFDAEEPPYYLTPGMGSVFYYHHQRKEEIHCTIVLDLCGHDVPVPGMEDFLFITGVESACELQSVFKKTDPINGERAPMSLKVLPTLNRYIGDMSDHHVFRVHGKPYLFLSCGRWQHYHQPSDTPEQLNYSKLAAVSVYVSNLVTGVGDVKVFEKPNTVEDDTLELELFYLHERLAPLLGSVGMSPRSRKDLDTLVGYLINHLGL